MISRFGSLCQRQLYLCPVVAPCSEGEPSENRYNHRVQTQVFELHGTLDLSDLTRFQYFYTLRRTWPVAAFAALILVLVAPLGALAMITSRESGWRQVFANALPFFGLLLLWLLLLGAMPYRDARKALTAPDYLRVPITYIHR